MCFFKIKLRNLLKKDYKFQYRSLRKIKSEMIIVTGELQK
ncbi:hypothetical protein LEP1GSC172_1618 [Leptospira noguchii]|uniref:Uncharacterized protein n=1 Tax=Leptospira noguchii TaxID=28182 RepID=M6W023_9LEPT|nr:hypothetical protein LEP1GSC172_1618 [Leptospira noguchii]